MEFDRVNRASHRINMVPLINIVFLLLIFFMLSTTLVAPDKLSIQTPESENSKDQKQVGLTITISNEGKFYLEDKITSLEAIADNFSRYVEEGKVFNILIKADAHSKTENVILVLEQARNAGIENIALATQTALEK